MSDVATLLRDPDVLAKFETLTHDDQIAYAWRLKWLTTAFKHQIVPEGDWWTVWLLLAGRGAGKTRTAAEQIGWWAWTEPKTRWLVAAPTSSDVRATCFEGDSGLLSVIPHELIREYKTQPHELYLTNGSLIKGIPASEPERFRGPQFCGGWMDELAAWEYLQEAWDMSMFGMRLGKRIRLIASTTPKPKDLIRQLVKREGKDLVLTRASTYDNIENLAPEFKKQVLQYEGTKLGRQEIYAEVIDPEEDGIIKRSWIKVYPADKPLPQFEFIVMSLDTAFTEASVDKKGDADPSACTVWGIFREDKKPCMMLLDCWEERLGLPDLIERVKEEMKVRYGDGDKKPMIAPLVGPKTSYLVGKSIDLLLIEDKGSGISLRQMLSREGIMAYPYNPGRADKLSRLHAVSHIFAHGHIWMVESEKRPKQFKTWAEPLVSQLCSFTGERSIKHDDLMDSATQAIRYMSDKQMLSVTIPMPEQTLKPQRSRVNPYAI
jgi:predicted phage terminase large subunit-like protein